MHLRLLIFLCVLFSFQLTHADLFIWFGNRMVPSQNVLVCLCADQDSQTCWVTGQNPDHPVLVKKGLPSDGDLHLLYDVNGVKSTWKVMLPQAANQYNDSLFTMAVDDERGNIYCEHLNGYIQAVRLTEDV